jgi:hypothetical protein
MSAIGKPERATQKRVITLFREELGYRYLGAWTDRPGNSTVGERLPMDIDAELAGLEQCHAKTRDLKHCIMQKLPTGKVRLV